MSHSTNTVLEFKQQVTQLQSQMSKLRVQKNPEPKGNSSKMKHTNIQSARENPLIADHKLHHRPRPGYRFQCNEDEHVASICENDLNPSLVADKRKQLKECQALWDIQHGPSASGALNAGQSL